MLPIHDLPGWPDFTWDESRLLVPLAACRYIQGRLSGQIQALGFKLQEEIVLRSLTDEVLRSSELEGETLDSGQVRSSVARRFGMNIGGLTPADRQVDGVVQMMLDASQRYDQPLSRERLFGWHAALIPAGRSGLPRAEETGWRDHRAASMPVASAPGRRERVLFDAARLDEEMRRFLEWFNAPGVAEPVLKAALAHLWLVTIHPFDEGNGRIARAVADMALARSEASPQRFFSMSAQIWSEREDYHRALQQTQQGTLDVTPWMKWFLGCLTRAIEARQADLSGAIARARFWEKLRDVALNDRQRLVINRLLAGFDGKLTTTTWAALTKSSQDTALRDVQQLVEHGVLVRDSAGGRSTSYSFAAI